MLEMQAHAPLQRIQVMLGEAERNKAAHLARERGLSVSEILRRALRAYQPDGLLETLSETEQTSVEMLIEAWRESMRTALRSVDEAREAIRQLKAENHEHA
jgi:hypothetical protein